MCKLLCELPARILHISDRLDVHPAHVTPESRGKVTECAWEVPFGLGIDKPTAAGTKLGTIERGARRVLWRTACDMTGT